MKKPITLFAAILISATPAFATYVEDKPKPPVTEEPRHESNDHGAIAVLIGIGAVLWFSHTQRNGGISNDEPRPQVRPELCMSKVNGVDVFIACPE